MSIGTLAARLEWAGGDQLGRLNKQKLRSLRDALKHSYNARQIKTPNKSLWYGLINEDDLKQDYDKKILSIEFDAQLEAGDVFEIFPEHSHWMVYLPFLTETAYLRSEVIRCRYSINIDGEEYWVYFQGPTETDISWYSKNDIAHNKLNLSGTIYIKKDARTEDFFSRFQHLKLDGHTWEVQVVDKISVPGIIELEVQEYYDNPIAELPVIKKRDTVAQIIGETIVKQDTVQGYKIDLDCYSPDYHWEIEGNKRVKILEECEDGKYCKVQVYPGAVRSYRVKYTNGTAGYHLDVSIDIAKAFIDGETKVKPYDVVTYKVEEPGKFWIESKAAKVIDSTDKTCKVEVVKMKKGSFDLFFKSDTTGETHTLTVEIMSL